MYGLDQIGSTLGDFINAVVHPSVANLPAGFLFLVFAVLMITALDQPSDIERAVEAGTDDFMTKPINKAELLLRVKAALKSRQQRQPLDQALAYIEGVQAG